MSQRALARQLAMNPAYLSLVLQGKRAPSHRLLTQTARVLELPADYFREYREQVVIERIRSDPQLLERAYALVTRSSR